MKTKDRILGIKNIEDLVVDDIILHAESGRISVITVKEVVVEENTVLGHDGWDYCPVDGDLYVVLA